VPDLAKPPTHIVGEKNPIFRLGVYGEGGSGKTTLALSFPQVLVVDTDGGLEGDAVIDIQGDEWSPDKWQDLNDLYRYLKEKITGKVGYKTIVIDSIDTLCNFLRHEAENTATAGRPANAAESQMLMSTDQDYGKVWTAVDIFLTKLRVLQQEKGVHIVLTSGLREANPEKDRPKRTFDCQPAVEGLLTKWCNTYGELVVKEVKVDPDDPKSELEERRILWTKASDAVRKNKTRWGALRPGVSDPTFTKLVSLIEKGKS
jgi:hypothetical protein